METNRPRHWVLVLALDDVVRGVGSGHVEAAGGADTHLRRLARGDLLVCYSPRDAVGAPRPLQHLTALGEVLDVDPHRVEEAGAAGPWRRRVRFEEVRAVPIRPLLPLLGFIDDEQRWGMPFRRGLLEVSAGDFGVLAGALRDAATMDDAFSASGRRAEA